MGFKLSDEFPDKSSTFMSQSMENLVADLDVCHGVIFQGKSLILSGIHILLDHVYHVTIPSVGVDVQRRGT